MAVVENGFDRGAYPSNTKTVKKEETGRKVKKVVSGRVSVKKPSVKQRIIDGIVGDPAKDIGDYILFDVLIPNICGGIIDIVTGCAEMVFGNGAKNRTRQRNRGYMAYNTIGESKKRNSLKTLRSDEFRNISFSNYGDAEEVLSEMIRLIEEYGSVSVRDFYEMTGQSFTHLDEKFGWTTLDSCRSGRDSDGYVINFPRPKALD